MIIAYVPARQGSKRLANKNFKSFVRDKSLTEVALSQARAIDQNIYVVLDTDSCEFIDYAKERNLADFYIERDPSLSHGAAKTQDVIRSGLKQVIASTELNIDFILLLQTTSPLRSLTSINKMISSYKISQTELLVSTTKVPLQLSDIVSIQGDNSLKKISIDHSQDQAFINGGIYIVSPNRLYTHSDAFTPTRKEELYFVDLVEFIDIDTPEQFELAQVIYNENLLK